MLEGSKCSTDQRAFLAKEYYKKIDSYLREIKIKNGIYKVAKLCLKPAKFVLYSGAFVLGIASVSLIRNNIASRIGERFFSIEPLTFGASVYFLSLFGVASSLGQKIIEKFKSETYFDALIDSIERKIAANSYLYEALFWQRNIDFGGAWAFHENIDKLKKTLVTDSTGDYYDPFIKEYQNFIFDYCSSIVSEEYSKKPLFLKALCNEFFTFKKGTLYTIVSKLCADSKRMYIMNELIQKNDFITEKNEYIFVDPIYKVQENIDFLYSKYDDLFQTILILLSKKLNYYRNIRNIYPDYIVNMHSDKVTKNTPPQYNPYSGFVRIKNNNSKFTRKMIIESKKNEIDEKIALCELLIQQFNHLYQLKEDKLSVISLHKIIKEVNWDAKNPYLIDSALAVCLFFARTVDWNLVKSRIEIKNQKDITIIVQKMLSILDKDVYKIFSKMYEFGYGLQEIKHNTK